MKTFNQFDWECERQADFEENIKMVVLDASAEETTQARHSGPIAQQLAEGFAPAPPATQSADRRLDYLA